MVRLLKSLTKFFSNAVNNLCISRYDYFNDNSNESDPILKAILKYEKHDSIIKIKQLRNEEEKFSFTPIESKVVANEIRSLNTQILSI